MIAANMMDISFASVGPDEPVSIAARAMSEGDSGASVAVLGPDRVLAGEVTAAVIASAAAGDGLEGLTVDDVMDRAPVTVGPDAGIRELASLLGAGGNAGRTIYVVDDSRRLLGTITPAVMVERLCIYIEKKASSLS